MPSNLDQIAFNVLMGDAPLTGVPHSSIHPFHNEDVPLWECACRECTRLDWKVTMQGREDGNYQNLADWRYEQFPEIWPLPA